MRKLVFAALVVTVAVLAVTSGFAAPRMVLPEAEFDFGLVPQNSEISHVFWIYNQGDDTLKIEKVVPG
jgi:hypothetical protein